MRVLLNYNLSFLASALSACNIFALYTTLSHGLIKKLAEFKIEQTVGGVGLYWEVCSFCFCAAGGGGGGGCTTYGRVNGFMMFSVVFQGNTFI